MKHVSDFQNADNLAMLGPLVQVELLPHPQVRAQFLAQGKLSDAVVPGLSHDDSTGRCG